MVDIEGELRQREIQLKEKELQLQQLIAKEERRRRMSQNLIGLVGAIFAVAAGIATVAFWEKGYNTAPAEERIIEMLYMLDNQIERLNLKMDNLERRLGGGQTESSFTRIQAEVDNEMTRPGKREFDPNLGLERQLNFRQYILPGIYGILLTLLFISALVALASKHAARKETAVELTKTLMTFFIGAATGHV